MKHLIIALVLVVSWRSIPEEITPMAGTRTERNWSQPASHPIPSTSLQFPKSVDSLPLRRDTVNWQHWLPPRPADALGDSVINWIPLEISYWGNTVILIDSNYQMHVTDSLYAIQTLIKILLERQK